MSLLKGLQAALFLSTATFSLAMLPLAKYGDQTVEVRVDHQTEFSGALRDMAPPYFGAAALISLSVGAAAFGIAGWKSSHQDRKQLGQSLKSLEKKVVHKDKQIQSLRLSDRRLQSQGLAQFLQNSTAPALPQAKPQRSAPAAKAKPQQTVLKPVPAQNARPAQAKLQAGAVAAAPKPQVSAQKVPAQIVSATPAAATAHAFSVQAGHHSQPKRYGQAQAELKTKAIASQSVQQPVSLRA